MIIGIGTDICRIERIAELRRKYGPRFLDRVFTEIEQYYCEGPTADERYAARFAAKEAVMKALGTGWRKGIIFKDIELPVREMGPPQLVLHGESKRYADSLGVTKLHVSLTHEREHAMAFVILEGE